jgi:hypothetical protein
VDDRADDRRCRIQFDRRANAFATLCASSGSGNPRFGGIALFYTTVVAALAGNFPAILAATIAGFLIGALGALILSRVSGVERKSTFFASIPGAAMAMAMLAERHGA